MYALQERLKERERELAEREAELSNSEDVVESQHKRFERREKRLVAYVVLSDSFDAATVPSVEALRTHLKMLLPEHMIPSAFVMLERMPLADEPVVSKSVNSAFIGTDLDLRLRRLRADRIVTFGISTDMCVSTTIRTGANMGWRFTLAADACDCFDLPDGKGGTIPATAIQAAHVATLAMEFCEVVTTSDLLGQPAAAPIKLSLE